LTEQPITETDKATRVMVARARRRRDMVFPS
jgi:hypothetical protein